MYIAHYDPEENMRRFAYITSEFGGGWVKVFVFGVETTVLNNEGVPTKRWRPYAGCGSYEMFQRTKSGLYRWRYDHKKETYVPCWQWGNTPPEEIVELHTETQEEWDKHLERIFERN